MTQQAIVPFDYASLDAETRIVVQQRASEIKSLMHRTMQDILEIGKKFAEVRELLRHNKAGGFEGWLAAERIQKTTAYNFIQVHAAFANRPDSGQLDILITALLHWLRLQLPRRRAKKRSSWRLRGKSSHSRTPSRLSPPTNQRPRNLSLPRSLPNRRSIGWTP